MKIEELIDQCAAVAQEKGFDLHQHATQVALIATEVAEAIENIVPPTVYETRFFVATLLEASTRFEQFRRMAQNYEDDSIIEDPEQLLEELADIVIRVFTYVGGNDAGEMFVEALRAKIEKNAARPLRHGKGF